MPLTLEDLERPGPARSRAVGAIAGRLIMGHAICRDRAHASAPAILDAAIAAARTAPTPAELEPYVVPTGATPMPPPPLVFDGTRAPAHERVMGPGPLEEPHGDR